MTGKSEKSNLRRGKSSLFQAMRGWARRPVPRQMAAATGSRAGLAGASGRRGFLLLFARDVW